MTKAFMAAIAPGAWVKVNRTDKVTGFVFEHHGIISAFNRSDGAGSVQVIHFCGPGGSSDDDSGICIRETSLKGFVGGGVDPTVVHAVTSYLPEKVVRRARSQIGKRGYQLPVRNCEHFASWCYTGQAYSQQVMEVSRVCVLATVVFGVLSVVTHLMAGNPWMAR
jgi:Lecithin retinol acyltransferase